MINNNAKRKNYCKKVIASNRIHSVNGMPVTQLDGLKEYCLEQKNFFITLSNILHK